LSARALRGWANTRVATKAVNREEAAFFIDTSRVVARRFDGQQLR
jgi:hypothetical protein